MSCRFPVLRAIGDPPRRTCSAAPEYGPPGCARCARAARRYGRRSRAAPRILPPARPVSATTVISRRARPRPPPARWPSCRWSTSPAARRPAQPSAATCLAKIDLVVVVVADGGEDRAVGGQRDRAESGPLALEAADELGREVLRIGGRAAVAAGQHLAAAGDAADERAAPQPRSACSGFGRWYFRSALSMKCCWMRCSSMGTDDRHAVRRPAHGRFKPASKAARSHSIRRLRSRTTSKRQGGGFASRRR